MASKRLAEVKAASAIKVTSKEANRKAKPATVEAKAVSAIEVLNNTIAATPVMMTKAMELKAGSSTTKAAKLTAAKVGNKVGTNTTTSPATKEVERVMDRLAANNTIVLRMGATPTRTLLNPWIIAKLLRLRTVTMEVRIPG